jgi:hypothetical protein
MVANQTERFNRLAMLSVGQLPLPLLNPAAAMATLHLVESGLPVGLNVLLSDPHMLLLMRSVQFKLPTADPKIEIHVLFVEYHSYRPTAHSTTFSLVPEVIPLVLQAGYGLQIHGF